MSVRPNKRKAALAARRRATKITRVKESSFTEPVFPAAPIQITPEVASLGEIGLTPKGRKRLINAAKHLVGSYLQDAGFTPLKEQTGYTLKTMTIRNYEELKLVFGPTTQAEKDMHDALDLIGDVMLGRPIVSEIEFGQVDEELFATGAEMAEVIKRFNKDYKVVGGGTIRNIGLKTPDYDEAARNEADRRNPEKFRLLKTTSQNRYHVVLFGKLYSFGRKKAATAS
jgi:hypothetical protein